MADGIDEIARWLGGGALALSVLNTWLAIQRDRRDRKSLLPSVAVDFAYESTRRVAVDVTITNSLPRPVLLTKVQFTNAGRLHFEHLPRADPTREGATRDEATLKEQTAPEPNTVIKTGETLTWEGVLFVAENMASPIGEMLQLAVYLDLRDGSRPRAFKFRRRL